MWIFSFSIVPILFILYLFLHKEFGYYRASLVGLFCGAFFCICAILFGSDYREYSAGILGSFFSIFLYETLLPLSCLSFLILLLSRDEMKYKVNLLLPTFFGFFVLFTPFRVFFRSETVSVFVLFLKPILMVSCIIGVASTTKLLMNLEGKKNSTAYIILVSCSGIVATVTPSIAEICWHKGMSILIWNGVGLLGIVGTLVLCGLSHREWKQQSLEKIKDSV